MFSLYDGVAGKEQFPGLSRIGRRQGCNCNLETRDFLVAGPVRRRQGYNCNLGTRDFWGQAELEGDRATTATWKLEIFYLVAGPVGRRQGYNCNLGSRDFWGQA